MNAEFLSGAASNVFRTAADGITMLGGGYVVPKLARAGVAAALDTLRGLQFHAMTRGIAAQVDAFIGAGDLRGLAALGKTVKPGDAATAVAGGRTWHMARGNIIDAIMKERASQTWLGKGLKYIQRGQYGPDIINPSTGRAWDITTPGQWEKHVRKYLISPLPGRPVWRSLDPLFTR
jgi:hypothetical protein